MKFSERQGLSKPRESLQNNSMDDRLRNKLWNTTYYLLAVLKFGRGWLSETYPLQTTIHDVIGEFFGKQVDEIPDQATRAIKMVRELFFQTTWYEVYNFIEFIGQIDNSFDKNDNYFRDAVKAIKSFRNDCNIALESEMSAYRFVGNQISPIIHEQEIVSIELALEHKNDFRQISTHINTALAHISNREKRDYRNSIKESISAVEAAARLTTGKPSATLGDALKVLEQDGKLHGALKNGFSSLYGYTSDADGIRHSLLDDPNLDFDDAKFFLVACAAFANYLIGKTARSAV